MDINEANQQHEEQQGSTALGTPNRPSFAAPDDNYLMQRLAERDAARREDKGGTRFERNERNHRPSWGSAREALNSDDSENTPQNFSSADSATLPSPAETKTPQPAADEPPAYFHSLNDRLQRQEQEMSRKEAEHREYMANLMRQQQQMYAQANQQPDTLYQEFALPTPDALNAFENRVLQKAHQMTAPMMAMLAQEKFEKAFHEVASSNEHFNKYFNIDKSRQLFNQIIATRPIQQTMAIDWKKEFNQAYDVADAPRRTTSLQAAQKEIADLKAQLAGKTTNKQAERKEKTNNLHLVPKANQQGSSPLNSSNSLSDYQPGEGRKRKMGDLTRFLKRKHGLG